MIRQFVFHVAFQSPVSPPSGILIVYLFQGITRKN